MMNVMVLGSGGSVPSPIRNLPAVAVQIEGDIVLFDCGEGTQRQMMKLGMSYSKVQAVFISHLHLDHFLGVFGLSETLRLNGRTEPLPIFAPRGASALFHAFRKFGILQVHEFDAADLSSGKPLFTLHSHDIHAFEVDHGPNLDAFGFLVKERPRRRFYEAKAKKAGLAGPLFKQIEKEGSLMLKGKKLKLEDVTYVQEGLSLAYSGDTVHCKNLATAARGVDLLLHECTFDDSLREAADEKYHSTASDAANAAKEAHAKRLVLLHASGRYGLDDPVLLGQARKIFKNTELASDGWSIELK